MVRHKPPDENTGQEAHYRQEYLPCDEVKPVKQRFAKHHQSINST